MSSPVLSHASRLRGLRPDWLSDPKVWRTEVLAGLVVALALIPEAISFSIIAGVDPAVGLFASFTMAVTISVVGGRRAMISAATGAVALVIAPLNREHGFGYLVATVILAGVFQIVLGALGVAKLMRFVPRSVMVGFVNALAVLIFMAQVPEMHDVPWAVYPLIAAGLALMVFFPKVTTVIPAPLVSIVVLTVITVAAGIAVPTVGDKGALPSSLPVPGLPDVPFTLDTLTTVAPYALAMALVGLMESLMTAKLVDDITDTHSSKTRESIGQGVANIVTGFFGGMGGCAMIGQTMINVKVSGARTRLSTFLAGSFLMVLCIVFGPVVSDIPMAALVAVMVMVSFATFDWHSIAPKTLRRMPAGEITVMVLTVAVVVATSNLAIGVVVGSLTAMAVFAKRVAHLADVTSVTDPDGTGVVYSVTGELFFASSNDLVGRFDYTGDPDKVVIDLSAAHVWDASSVAALDAVETKYAQRGKDVEIIGLNDPSADLHGRLTGELTGGH
ncbi:MULTISPECIES: SulP family inorganic anion transporter [unclassified Streptomyces]|uniref:SulP family inorganic anion transporter n=1 Tax=unclassified Streptomyces TaxID=2593676 RepID=UPI00225811EC|nr:MULTISPECIES: SulP family inorganic anion transporter [unclassified Streptomyces]WSW11116.1 SulP family inorganic anion transporter [Streptomyces sp. NBC_01005]WTB61042.1 SulP family inorganic anion transporter [Streptomyces sp. NBC_00826]WTD00624.1 SulP family inorganic anion transporter [Streptomyces sp. NBC_01650]WTH96183.1 SulP family inorganic anion transporter [Streptomyces sp. NBC_00825]WTI04794.1 SulP family inorganic anion transporter [Streptomyces sp. NBC_00822]